jgi:protein SCO1/2
MNKNPDLKKTFAHLALLAVSALALAACDSPPAQLPLERAPLAGAAIGGPFSLIDQEGKTRSNSEWNDKYQIVYFGYTVCPDICTPDTQNLMAGLKLFEQSEPQLASKIQPLFITVDPARDTPAILAQFVRAFHPRLIGLTGTADQISSVSKSFAIYANRIEGSQPDAYLMAHSQTPYLMGPGNKPLALMPVDDPKTPDNEGSPQAVVAELAKWVR